MTFIPITKPNADARDKRMASVFHEDTGANKKMEEEKIAVVTGSSSGIGYETSLLLAKNGFLTYATVRSAKKAKTINDLSEKGELPLRVIELDVNSDNSVENAIDKILNESKRIDVLVNNAGYALVGALEDLSMDEIKSQFETNVFGAIRVMKAVLPGMRKQHGGTIVNVSSMGGRVALPLSPAYHGTKFALEGVSESMRFETDSFGIRVILIEPGTIRSNFIDNAKVGKRMAEADSPYAPKLQTLQKVWGTIFDKGAPPVEVAKVILQAVTSNDPSIRYMVGDDAIQMMQARRGMSDLEFEGLVKQRFFGQ